MRNEICPLEFLLIHEHWLVCISHSSFFLSSLLDASLSLSWQWSHIIPGDGNQECLLFWLDLQLAYIEKVSVLKSICNKNWYLLLLFAAESLGISTLLA